MSALVQDPMLLVCSPALSKDQRTTPHTCTTVSSARCMSQRPETPVSSCPNILFDQQRHPSPPPCRQLLNSEAQTPGIPGRGLHFEQRPSDSCSTCNDVSLRAGHFSLEPNTDGFAPPPPPMMCHGMLAMEHATFSKASLAGSINDLVSCKFFGFVSPSVAASAGLLDRNPNPPSLVRSLSPQVPQVDEPPLAKAQSLRHTLCLRTAHVQLCLSL